MLALVPGTRKAPGTGANTGPYIHPELRDERVFAGLHHAGYHAWLDHVWHAAACTRPIRLRGDIKHIDAATGELLRTIPTIGMPDGSIYKACGNRRATTCPGCAETYRRDAYHLLRAGLIGGKGVTPDVAGHPAVFVTFTAPSFGPVHARPVRQHTCADRSRCTCRPQPCHARRDPGRCPHGRHDTCFTRHRPRRSQARPAAVPGLLRLPRPRRLEQPGRRTVAAHQASHRTPPRPARPPPWRAPDLGPLRRRQIPPGRPGTRRARQSRRIPGPRSGPLPRPAPPRRLRPRRPGPAPAPARRPHHRRPGRRHPVGRPGHQLLHPGSSGPARRLDHHLGHRRSTSASSPWLAPADVTDLAVASYLAKYSTKGTEVTGHASARITPDNLDLYANPDGTHPERLIAACWKTGADPGYIGLRRWAHMLGFGGHFLTKARRYSVRFRDLREARITYRRGQDPGPEHGPIRTADHTDDETILIVGTFTFAGTGWKTSGDALLANTAADQARKRRQAGRDELADEYAESMTSQAA